jgi:hypothetical protein
MAGRGSFCISIDLELAWGVWDQLSREDLDRCLSLERRIVTRILEIFKVYDTTPIWVIVVRSA